MSDYWQKLVNKAGRENPTHAEGAKIAAAAEVLESRRSGRCRGGPATVTYDQAQNFINRNGRVELTGSYAVDVLARWVEENPGWGVELRRVGQPRRR